MTLKTKKGIAILLFWIKETDITVPVQSPWNIPLLPVKKTGASGSHVSDSSRETGAHGLGPGRCALQPPIGRSESTPLGFYQMDRPSGRLERATSLEQVAPGCKDTK